MQKAKKSKQNQTDINTYENMHISAEKYKYKNIYL